MAMSIRSLLCESMKLPCKKGKLTLFILLILLVPDYLFYFAITSPLKSQIDNITAQLVSSVQVAESIIDDGLMNNMKNMAIYVTAITFVKYFLSIFGWIIVTDSVHATRLGKQLSNRNLISKVRKTWVRVVITTLTLLPLLNIVQLVFQSITSFCVFIIFYKSPLALYSVVTSILSYPSTAYVNLVYSIAQVSSVLDDGCCGIGALKSAMKDLRGRRMKGLGLPLVLLVIDFLCGRLSGLLTVNGEGVFYVGLGLVDLSLKQMVFFFNVVVYAVFYMDCRESESKLISHAGLELQYGRVLTE